MVCITKDGAEIHTPEKHVACVNTKAAYGKQSGHRRTLENQGDLAGVRVWWRVPARVQIQYRAMRYAPA